jgi:hypothetical protein
MWNLAERSIDKQVLLTWNLYNLRLIVDSKIYSLHFGKIKVLVNAAVHSEHGQLIKYDIWLRSVERSGDVENGTYSRK